MYVGPTPNSTRVYSWNEVRRLLCHFANCILEEIMEEDNSPLRVFEHRILPHIESLLQIKVVQNTHISYYVGVKYTH